MGRYGNNSSSDHDYRDMDYRGYGQEEAELETGYDLRAGAGRSDKADQPAGVREFTTPARFHDQRPGFRQRGGGRGSGGGPGRGGKGFPSPCSPRSLVLPQPEVALSRLQREERMGEASRRDFQSFKPNSEGRGRGGGGRGGGRRGRGERGYPENNASHMGEREGDWGRMEGGVGGGVTPAGQEEYSTLRGGQGEEERFLRGGGQGEEERFLRGGGPGEEERFLRGGGPGKEERFLRGGGPGKRKGFSMGSPGDDCGGKGPGLLGEGLGASPGGPDPLSSVGEDPEQRELMEYRPDLLDQNQRPSNIIMLRMLPPNATC
ncbi:keratin, type I cytoskeletal 9-like [Salvelinus sp. IW2-2015]|uniref:keratin, type I cytoskeletal 9-like n=1 Tax=Salvelinus sp. IW2-2015 TaxID=2691554 RepID=UPI0038D35626